MPQINWNEEGTIIRTDEDGTRWSLVGAVGPEVTEKQNRFRELEDEKQRLEEKLNVIRTEQQQIDQWMATHAGGWDRV